MMHHLRGYAANGGLILAIVAALTLVFSGFGVHEEMFDLDYAVTMLATGWAPGLAIVGGLFGLVGLLAGLMTRPPRGRIVSLLAIAIAAVTFAVSGQVRLHMLANPPIHDVATDWSDPLTFGAAVIKARGDNANAVDPDPRVQPQPQNPNLTGTRVAEVNARTCASAAPVVLTTSVQTAYDKARAALLMDGETLVTENPEAGRIEAAAVTKWLKLKGDVLVRIKPEGAGARVDIRSVSRTGIRDLGENCRRVTRLRAAIGR